MLRVPRVEPRPWRTRRAAGRRRGSAGGVAAAVIDDEQWCRWESWRSRRRLWMSQRTVAGCRVMRGRMYWTQSIGNGGARCVRPRGGEGAHEKKSIRLSPPAETSWTETARGRAMQASRLESSPEGGGEDGSSSRRGGERECSVPLSAPAVVSGFRGEAGSPGSREATLGRDGAPTLPVIEADESTVSLAAARPVVQAHARHRRRLHLDLEDGVDAAPPPELLPQDEQLAAVRVPGGEQLQRRRVPSAPDRRVQPLLRRQPNGSFPACCCHCRLRGTCTEAIQDAPLPPHLLAFTPHREKYSHGRLEFFALFGRGERRKKSLLPAVDYNGRLSFAYDLDERSLHDIACTNRPKQLNPLAVAAGDALYVMDMRQAPGGDRCAFEALTYGPPMDVLGKPGWHWHCLPPPPYVLEPGYKAATISAYTVVGGSNIWVSVPGIGTYSFDTVSSSWSRAGSWVLPFHGRADHVPEHDDEDEDEPTLENVWVDLHAPGHWILRKSCLVHLGLGKFCVAKFFETEENELTERGFIPQTERFVVLTGLELRPGTAGTGLDMIRHRSLRYKFEAMTACWAF
ncbi:hypothetical protein ACP70R_013284 [Stipagrostis hirtigluma subsp. patula]